MQKFFIIPADRAELRQTCDPVKGEDISTLKGHMYWLNKLRKRLNGAAIAAPQLGDTRRWFIWERGLVINPEIRDHGIATAKQFESCLSFPKLSSPRERYITIEVKYLDENGHTQFKQFQHLEARIFQHELDHLNGICIDQPQKDL